MAELPWPKADADMGEIKTSSEQPSGNEQFDANLCNSNLLKEGQNDFQEHHRKSDLCMDSLGLNPASPLMDKIVLYETKTRFYIVGSSRNESAFRILKIDRTSPYTIQILDDHVRYSRRQLEELLVMIDDGNKASGGLERVLSAFGIFGMVRFLEGFYIIFITKRRTCCVNWSSSCLQNRRHCNASHSVWRLETSQERVREPLCQDLSKYWM